MIEQNSQSQSGESKSTVNFYIKRLDDMDAFERVAATPTFPQSLKEQWKREIESGKTIMLAAYDGETPIGRLNLRWGQEEFGQIPMLYAVVVDSDYRKQGIGTKLMTEAEQQVRVSDGPKLLGLGVNPGNEIARKFYEELGYKYKQVKGEDIFTTSWPEKNEDGSVTTKIMPAMLMVKNLEEPQNS
jgi:ribosomal protein S18 acetylase RimI-like enzyme